MKSPPFVYHAPSSVAEAVALLSDLDNAKLLAGGQSLVPMLAMRYAMPDDVVDLNRVAELSFVRDEGDEVVIGAMTRQRTLERDETLRRRLPVFAEALRWVGHLQTRNRGTLGGSLCHLDPSAEMPALAMALDAELEVAGPDGSRQLAMRDFPAFYMTPAIEPQEILTAVRLRPWSPAHRFGFVELSRRHGDFAMVGAVVLLELGALAEVQRASVTLFGIGQSPVRVAAAEATLVGRPLDSEAIAAASACCSEVDAMEDSFVSADYRRQLAGVLSGRALRQARERPVAPA